MNRNTIWLLLFFLFFACAKRSIDPEVDGDLKVMPEQYWTAPREEAIILFFRVSEAVRLESILAGEIQFHLERAKLVDDRLKGISAAKDWELGKLLVFTTAELYSSFDTTACRFGNTLLDSLLVVYEIERAIKRSGLLRLIFPKYYNMPVLAEIFGQIPGVRSAEPNYYGSPGICDADISLAIIDNLYKFLFTRSGSCGYYFWEVHVIDDSAKLVAEGHTPN